MGGSTSESTTRGPGDVGHYFGDASKKFQKGDVGGGSKDIMDSYVEFHKGALGASTKRQEKKLEESRKLREQGNIASQGVLDRMDQYDNAYLDKTGGYTDSYLGKVRGLESEATQQGKDAQATYTNDIQPRYKGIMEEAQREAGDAMSLKEAGNVNNQMHQDVRGMYNQQASNIGRAGIGDVGVLNAMGQQATAQQMGQGGPMSGAQMQLLNAQNMQQSGAAMSRTQGQMSRLREQGINRGFEESANQYNRGQMAKDRYAGSVRGYEGGMDRNIDRQRAFRGERQGYGADIFGTEMGRARDVRGTNQGRLQRDMAQLGNVYGGRQTDISNQIAIQNADNAAHGSIIGAGGQAVGSYYGGQQGGQQGQQRGSGPGRNAQAPQTSSYQGGYNNQPQQRQGMGGYNYGHQQQGYGNQNYYGNYA